MGTLATSFSPAIAAPHPTVLESLSKPQDLNAGMGGGYFNFSLQTPTAVKLLSRLDPISSQS